jgi:hypothetical protein
MKLRVLFALALLTSVFAFCISVATLASAQSDKAIGFHNNHAEVYITFLQPLKAKERGKIKRMGGVRFYAAVSSTTYLARIREPALEKLQNHPLFVDIRQVELTDKLSTNLNTGSVGPHVINPDGTLAVYVRFYDDVKLPHALKSLRKTGIDFEKPKRFLFNNRILINATNEQILQLAQKINVWRIEEIPPPPKDDNINAAIFSNIDLIQAAPFDLDGDGVRFGQWESGHAQTNHPDLSPRINVIETGAGTTSHGTHVAGTLLGSGAGDANALGMAPGAWGIFAHSSAGDTITEQVDAVDDHQIVIANHSWGYGVGWPDDGDNEAGFGAYDGNAALYDAVVHGKGLIIVKSSGNDSNDCDPDDSTNCDGFLGGDGNRYDTIGQVGNAKNVITVGAVGNTAADPLITGFSSNGPSDDGRIKPDLVAKGDSLWSTCPGSTYCSKGGTSMAAPTTSGGTALLTQTYRLNFDGHTPSPDIVKALLVNTARDLGRPGPDYVYGHGLLDALPAAQTIDIGEVKIVTEAVGQAETDEYLLSVPAGLTELRVTLNWIDVPGAPNHEANDTVNSLDVNVEAPDGSLRYPFTGPGRGNVTGLATATGPNPIDTVESVVIDTPDQGIWIVRVGGTAVPFGPQNYALVANGFDGTGNIVRTSSFILPDQPDIRVNEALDFDELCEGDKQDLPVSIFNIGGADLLVHSITTTGSSAFSVLPDPSQPFIVQPGAHIEVTIRFEPDGIWGSYSGMLHIVSNDPDEEELAFEMTGELGRSIISTVIADTGNYGDVCSGDFSDLGLTIANGGGCPLVVNNISSGFGEFYVPQVLDYPLDIGPADSMEVPIRFEPDGICDDTTPREGVIIIHSNDPDTLLKPVDVSGFMPCPNLVIDPDAMTGLFAFPATVVDPEVTLGCYSEQSVAIRNTGRCPLNITSVDATGDDFTAIAPAILPIELPPGEETLLVDVRFTPQSGGDLLSPDEVTGTLTIVSDDPDASGLADLCGEGVGQSGVRILVTDVTSGLPLTVAEVDEIRLRSKGIKTPGPINLRFTDQPITSSVVCGNNVQWHVNLETLPATHTTGTVPKSSYTASAKEGNVAAEQNFSLAQCEFREFQIQLKDTSGDGGICPLGQKGDACTTDAECCSNKCKGPDGNKTCK